MTTDKHSMTAFSLAAGDLDVNLDLWLRHLAAKNLSPNTIESYRGAVRLLADFLSERGMPGTVGKIKREHLEAFIAWLLETRSASTAANRYRSLRPFFKWLIEEGELKTSPMAKMTQPRIAEQLPPVLDDDDLRRLLKTCERGDTFEIVRDCLILRVLVKTGCRRGELAGVKMDDVLDGGEGMCLRVKGKGGSFRLLPLDVKTEKALVRYLRHRAKHPRAGLSQFLIGHFGALGGSGVSAVVRRRAEQAGLKGVYAHLLRHTWAHRLQCSDIGELNVQTLGGWRSPVMLRRYGASAKQSRAIAAFRRLEDDL
jgi:site-specific recombinase XerD